MNVFMRGENFLERKLFSPRPFFKELSNKKDLFFAVICELLDILQYSIIFREDNILPYGEFGIISSADCKIIVNCQLSIIN